MEVEVKSAPPENPAILLDINVELFLLFKNLEIYPLII